MNTATHTVDGIGSGVGNGAGSFAGAGQRHSPSADQPADTSERARIAVWDVPTRIFHWSMALSFTGAFLTAESERWRDIHVMLGYTFLGLIVFRLVWGFVGSRYARFSSFVAGPAKIKRYILSLLSQQPEHHVGHNPAGALAILLLLGLGLAISLSGLAIYNEVGGEWLEELHEGAANAMLAVVAIHIVGVIVSSFAHRENLVAAMITGRKRGTPEEGIASRHRFVGIALLVTMLAVWAAWRWNGPDFLPGMAGDKAAAPWVQHDRAGDRQGARRQKDKDD